MSKQENKPGLPQPKESKESMMKSFTELAKEVEQEVVEQPEVKKVEEPSGPIKVMAIYNGFYKGCRIKAGDVFTVAGKKDLGKWMKRI